MDRVRVYGATEMTRSKAVALLVNGVIAFGLNVVSFTANKKTSALTMTVAGALLSFASSSFGRLVWFSGVALTDPLQPTLNKSLLSFSPSSSSTFP